MPRCVRCADHADPAVRAMHAVLRSEDDHESLMLEADRGLALLAGEVCAADLEEAISPETSGADADGAASPPLAPCPVDCSRRPLLLLLLLLSALAWPGPACQLFPPPGICVRCLPQSCEGPIFSWVPLAGLPGEAQALLPFIACVPPSCFPPYCTLPAIV